jgi:hypothetical protein
LFLQQPSAGDLYGYFVDTDTRRLEPWEKIIPSFKYSPEVCSSLCSTFCYCNVFFGGFPKLKSVIHSFQVPYFDLLVPTVDTVRFGFLLEKLISIQHSVLFTGMTGVGKVGQIVTYDVENLHSLPKRYNRILRFVQTPFQLNPSVPYRQCMFIKLM